MLKNLLAEMARKGYRNADIMIVNNLSDTTVRNKINEVSDFTFPETLRTRNVLFPEMDLEYLFRSFKAEATDNVGESEE